MAEKRMESRFPGTCKSCGMRFPVGTPIMYSKIGGARHADDGCEEAKLDPAAQPAPKANVDGGFEEVYAWFVAASEKLKSPAMRFTLDDGQEVKIYKAKGGKAPGVINVCEPAWGGAWYGRVHPNGMWDQPKSGVPAPVVALVEALAKDPIGTVTQYGLASTRCCFCNTELTDGKSVTSGYGPVCAKNWSLPWGG